MDPENARAERGATGIPRARGDGPDDQVAADAVAADSPRSRGWTRAARPPHRGVRGFPALAGMDPYSRDGARDWLGIPRARGDGPQTSKPSRVRSKDSPRSRGWTISAARAAVGGSGFPALAGMDPGKGDQDAQRKGIPRARGDGPHPNEILSVARADSPRSRGWTRDVARRAIARGGFPALAGMDPMDAHRARARHRIPRACGDGPWWETWEAAHARDSPRSRGWTVIVISVVDGDFGFPALAGMDPRPALRFCPSKRIPRARGDGPRSLPILSGIMADSPRSRGWTRVDPEPGQRVVGFPALAGMDPGISPVRESSQRIPRARGDGPCARETSGRLPSDSPRSRGWTLLAGRRVGHGRGFPALAGMDR